MRCGCPICGVYMIQAERGLSSGCICPGCGHSCIACNSANETPMPIENVKLLHLALDELPDNEEVGYTPASPADEKPADWIKLL